MTLLFSVFTVLALLAVALFAQVTGLAATSYFGLCLVLALYVAARSRKPAPVALATQGE